MYLVFLQCGFGLQEINYHSLRALLEDEAGKLNYGGLQGLKNALEFVGHEDVLMCVCATRHCSRCLLELLRRPVWLSCIA